MRKGEVWLVKLDPTVGDEIGKTRPVVVVSDDEGGKVAAQSNCSNYRMEQSFFPRYSFGWYSSNRHQKMAWRNSQPPILFQVRSVSQQRFVRPIGVLSDTIMEDISEALTIVLDLD